MATLRSAQPIPLVTTIHDIRLLLDRTVGDMLPALNPSNTRSLMVVPREAIASYVEESGASVGRPTETKLRSRTAANKAQRNVVSLDKPASPLDRRK